MSLISLNELAKELAVSRESIARLIEQEIITPYGGKARLGEPRFSTKNLTDIKAIVHNHVRQL
ncbi:MAG: hypothetical protein JXB48_11915 [Candidatus Latescibacteria bacterium]|nr:hypothetical protein [Candidatus Latescibacterota bacterium]